ncbi:MAG: class I SAM-dependent methyltransferase [Myxococcales bacterium]|nr:class I SAM-dependent methyltransferase [Myxococcales bacterium]
MKGLADHRLWRAFPAGRILHDDDDILVIDKPWGLATHAPEKGRFDDVASWLRAHFGAAGKSDYLGIHQRLDRETSGVLLFSRRKEANASLAKQFEGRAVEKTYVAVVAGRLPERATLRHFLREGDGRMEARPAQGTPKRGEQLAVTLLRSLTRKSGRVLVELSPETGRTHQLRVQLAALGSPIVGDATYGGAPGVRPLLHARRLVLDHPRTGERVTFEAPVPDDLERGLDVRPAALPESTAEITARIVEAAQRRFGVVAEGDTTALRIANAEGDALPGISLDLYGEHGVLSLYDVLDEATLARVLEGATSAGLRGVYAKFRPKDASRLPDTRREDVAPAAPLAGEAAPESFEIVERGVPFEVHLGDGLSTGIFLDQRENRARIRELAKGARFLNLFAYTGSFSVVAALGGARSTTTVDISRTVLAWAERNLARVGAHAPDHVTVESDAVGFLDRAARKGERFDLAVLDPPSFSTTKKRTFSAESDYADLAARTLKVMAPGGRLLACTNHRGITMSRFRKMLHEAARLAGVTAAQVKSLPAPADFPPPPGAEPHLKSVLVTLAK